MQQEAEIDGDFEQIGEIEVADQEIEAEGGIENDAELEVEGEIEADEEPKGPEAPSFDTPNFGTSLQDQLKNGKFGGKFKPGVGL